MRVEILNASHFKVEHFKNFKLNSFFQKYCFYNFCGLYRTIDAGISFLIFFSEDVQTSKLHY